MNKTLVGIVLFLVLLGTNAISLYKLAGLSSELGSTKSTLASVKAANDDLRAFTEDLQAQVLKAHIISASKRLKVQNAISRTRIGVALLSLLILLASCASKSTVIPQVKPTKCLHPNVQVLTNADLVLAISDYYSALELCNTLNGFKPNN